LEFMTNRKQLNDSERNLQGSEAPETAPDTGWHEAENLKDLLFGVFSSMDIPPLFKYMASDDKKDFFEDGGVIDNLPIQFGTQYEKCDLLFILPLNATFEQKVDQKSLARRLLRVMNIRQGVLERKAFKDLYLYNELAELREKVEGYQGTLVE